MQLLIGGQQYDVGDQPHKFGGEGEIYALNASNVAKVYHQDRREPERRQKVLALCDSYLNFASRHADYLIAFPELPAYEGAASFETIVGFSMARFEYPTIAELGYDLIRGQFAEADGIVFDDKKALAFVYACFDVLDQLHKTRIILGDVNPGNILCERTRLQPVIIDLDAAQVGGFACPATHEDYNDPRIMALGKAATSALNFDFGSDIYALGTVCFEFIVGVRPHMLYVKPPKRDKENKILAVSNIRCWSKGRDYLSQLQLSYFDCPENAAVEDRLNALKQLDEPLVNFFIALFVEGRRDSLLQTLSLKDPRNPAHHFLVESGFKTVIDHEVRRRARERIAARQGLLRPAGRVPDAGFREIIGRIAGTPRPQAVPVRVPKDRGDPIAFKAFVDCFGLQAKV